MNDLNQLYRDLLGLDDSWTVDDVDLDTMQFITEIQAAVPRCRCATCGVKTIAVPWAGKHSRFKLMFEAFAIRVLQAAANVKNAAELLDNPVTNAMSEGINSRIQSIKSAARGFRTFASYRIRILFYGCGMTSFCGLLDSHTGLGRRRVYDRGEHSQDREVAASRWNCPAASAK